MITQKRLKELLRYDPETGEFVWAIDRSSKVRAGHVAGHKHAQYGYIYIGIDGMRYRAHRLAWMYVFGEHPDAWIDHINGDVQDNRIRNLRKATPSQNQQNRGGAQRNSKSGLLGVQWWSPYGQIVSKPWRAMIRFGGKRLSLGYYATPEEAHAAYMTAKTKFHSHHRSET